MLTVPRTKNKVCRGEQAYSVVKHQIWNQILSDLQSTTELCPFQIKAQDFYSGRLPILKNVEAHLPCF